MRNFLIWIGLIECNAYKFPISKTEFIKHFQLRVNKSEVDAFEGDNEQITSHDNPFRGQVNNDGFKILSRPTDYEERAGQALATGAFKEKNNALLIESEIIGLRGMMKVMVIGYTIICTVIIIGFINADNIESEFLGKPIPAALVIPGALAMVALCFGMLYRMIKGPMKKMKRKLESEFNQIGMK